ncbi:MAG: hypothetical protein ACOY82_04870 [Pseudomonadota bacterium]
MLQRLIPLAFLFGGLALIVDYVAPPRRQASVVQSLSTSSDMEGETTYAVVIAGGALDVCHVDSDAYEALKQGDRIEVSASHLFDSCTRVVRGEEVVYSTWAQPLVALIFGVLLFGLGLMGSVGRAARPRSGSGAE